MNKDKLENMLREISLYEMCIDNHGGVPANKIYNVYRMMRQDIIKRYDLSRGEFTKYYAFTRGRK